MRIKKEERTIISRPLMGERKGRVKIGEKE